jgi:hypothetical protein
MIRRALYYITHWEAWHWLAKYIPILPVWCWIVARHRNPWFFTPSNPTLTFGGFFGEPKSEMYRQLPQRYCPASVYISPSICVSDLENCMETSGLTFPVAVKPNVGMMGLMFRRIEDVVQLARYHAAMTTDYIIQEWVKLPLEVSVFYYRIPGQDRGTITGFLKKEFLEVYGNGKKTLLQLMEDYPRVAFRLDEMKMKHRRRLHQVIPDGEPVILSQALNLSRGGKLVSLAGEKDERLLRVFDELSHFSGNFFFGRYDIKCESVEELKRGNFRILEYNGAGAEPHHIYGDGNSLFTACSILVQHWNMLSKISRCNRKRGVMSWTFRDGWNYMTMALAHFRALRELDLQFDADSSIQTEGDTQRVGPKPGAESIAWAPGNKRKVYEPA